MPEIVTVNSEAGIIEVLSTGNVSKTDMFATYESVAGYYRQHGITKLLIDATAMDSLPPIGDIYQFVVKMSQQGIKVKQAVVISDTTPESMRFVDDVANNRGVQFKIFTSRQAALEWLE
jgi:hypothetical protein